jgi:hypothetical protein
VTSCGVISLEFNTSACSCHQPVLRPEQLAVQLSEPPRPSYAAFNTSNPASACASCWRAGISVGSIVSALRELTSACAQSPSASNVWAKLLCARSSTESPPIRMYMAQQRRQHALHRFHSLRCRSCASDRTFRLSKILSLERSYG